MKHSYWLISIAFIFILNVAMTVLNWNDNQVIKAELKQPKRVIIQSNGQYHSFPVDNNKIKIEVEK